MGLTILGNGKVFFTLEEAMKVQSGEYKYSCTLFIFLTSTLHGGGWSMPLYPQERPSTYSIGGWVCLDGNRISQPHRDSIPELSIP